MSGPPRSIAIAIIRRGEQLLVGEVPDAVKGVTGWRPPGGEIEFGERGADAVRREICEELGISVVEPRYLGIIENIFTNLGATGHEMVLAYAVRFADPHMYERERLNGVESSGEPFVCIWKRITEFRADVPLYPEGLLALLT